MNANITHMIPTNSERYWYLASKLEMNGRYGETHNAKLYSYTDGEWHCLDTRGINISLPENAIDFEMEVTQ